MERTDYRNPIMNAHDVENIVQRCLNNSDTMTSIIQKMVALINDGIKYNTSERGNTEKKLKFEQERFMIASKLIQEHGLGEEFITRCEEKFE